MHRFQFLQWCFFLLALVPVRADFGNLRRIHERWLERQDRVRDSLLIQQGGLQEDVAAAVQDTMRQAIDHFSAFPVSANESNGNTFPQRFYYNSAHYRSGGPVFLYVGGEGELRETSVTRGEIVQAAKQYRGFVTSLEHRYYGASHPFRELTAENLRYLSSQQALQDLAAFIGYMKERFPELAQSPWIVVGGSYPGNLAAWFRLKFPHLVVGAWSSSAPVLAKSDYWEYDQVVGEQLGQVCADQVRAATVALEDILSKRSPQAQLEKDRIKNQFHPKMAQQVKGDVNFLYVLADIVAYAVQYDNPGVGLREALCAHTEMSRGRMTMGDDESAIRRFANFTRYFFDRMGSEPAEMAVGNQRSTTVRTEDATRQWMWQCCTEFGYWQTAPRPDVTPVQRLRSKWITEQWHLENICRDLFGFPATHRVPVDAINRIYGGLAVMNTTHNIMFINGGRDPWRALSVEGRTLSVADLDLEETASFLASNIANTTTTTTTTTKERHRRQDETCHPRNLESIVIPGVGHCSDLRAETDRDPNALVRGRLIILEQVGRWLRDYQIKKLVAV